MWRPGPSSPDFVALVDMVNSFAIDRVALNDCSSSIQKIQVELSMSHLVLAKILQYVNSMPQSG